MLQDLDGLDVAQRHSSSPDYLPSNVLPLCSTATQGVKDFCRGTSHWVNLYRQRIMLTEALMDRSIRMLIDHECPQVVQAHLAESPINTEDWLLTLTKKVAGLVICGLPVTAKSTEFFSEKELTPKVFAEDRRVVEKRKYLTPRKVEGVTLLYMRQILFHWFGSCTPFTSQAQSSFVHCIVSHLGAGALLLPAVWDAYGNIPDWMLASDCPTLHRADSSPDTRFKTEYFAPLSTALATANGLVEARRNLSELQDAYLDLHTRTYSYVQGVIEARTKNASLRRLVKTMSLAVTGAEPALDARLQLISQTLPTVSPRLTSLVEFLKDSYVVAELHANNDKNTPSTPSQQLMFSRPDYYLPLREIAPCRRIQQSSLSRAFAKTRAGLFSLQVFRFVFYNSQAFSTCPPEIRKVEFKTLEEFNQYLETLRTHFRRDDDAFFCDKQALGQTITQRSTSRAADYWTLSNRADFTWPPSRGFMTTWEDLHILKRSLGEENKHLWAGVGPLSTYLFVADMHFAGLLDAPEIDDIGNIIASLQKGAMAGLRKLKYLEEVATRAQVVAAFRQFYEDVEGSLTPQQQEQFSWSPIVAEHTLCKYSRMYGEGYYCG
ncbi:hypothetical protein BC629DRAFT_1231353 [Irpex lacteus]|nr:hypothetical protein BC629DRAFT_1231353 [Irpex lacteus]